MVYGPRIQSINFKGGKNILASEHLQYIEGGATLDYKAFDTGYNELGLLIARNTETGKFEPFVEGDGGEDDGTPEFDSHAILNVDFNNDAGQDLIAGEVIVRGSVYEDKLPVKVPTAFKEANPMIRYVKHI